MPKVVEVFTPNDLPTFTYVERAQRRFEDRLRDAIAIPKMIVSVSGPSKSGKTVLIKKVIEADNLISVSGASIRSADDLWSKVMGWMDAPVEQAETTGTKVKAEGGGQAGGEVGIPFLAKGKAHAEARIGAETSQEIRKSFETRSLQQVIKEIGGSTFAVFVDDFHYIPKDVQKEIGKQIKEAAENGVKIITASVPHRSDDVVRSNTELRGRVTAIDVEYWTEDELEQIAYRGFRELNIDLSPTIVRRLTVEAFGSPQLMQAIALHLCFEDKIYEGLPDHRRIEIDVGTLQSVLERTSTLTDFSSMLATLHAGPKQRGTERKEYRFKDGTKGDVYRCVLLAMKADPPQLSFRYDEMLTRTTKLCTKSDAPVGSSVSQALVQMAKLAETVQEAPVIEWDEDVLDIVEPYFLFFLRWSSFLKTRAQSQRATSVAVG
jgi:hypothetical protein